MITRSRFGKIRQQVAEEMREKAHFTPPAVLVPQLVEVPAPLEEKLRLAGQRAIP